MNENRSDFAEKYLVGLGVEFGALHNPLSTGQQSQVTYVDRFTKRELLKRFPELKKRAKSIVHTDIILDIDNDDFSLLEEQNFDFFIANHVIEHLINPMRFLEKVHDVMRSGSILFLSIPNKDHTFDKYRDLTTNDHLWQDYKENTSDLSDEDLNDFLLNITKDHIEPRRKAKMYFKKDKLPSLEYKKRRIYKLHRGRSIHVHVWNKLSFDQFLSFTISKLNLMFDIIDSNLSNDDELHEMIYILKKK